MSRFLREYDANTLSHPLSRASSLTLMSIPFNKRKFSDLPLAGDPYERIYLSHHTRLMNRLDTLPAFIDYGSRFAATTTPRAPPTHQPGFVKTALQLLNELFQKSGRNVGTDDSIWSFITSPSYSTNNHDFQAVLTLAGRTYVGPRCATKRQAQQQCAELFHSQSRGAWIEIERGFPAGEGVLKFQAVFNRSGGLVIAHSPWLKSKREAERWGANYLLDMCLAGV